MSGRIGENMILVLKLQNQRDQSKKRNPRASLLSSEYRRLGVA